MRMSTNLKIAFAHLTSRPRQTVVAVLSVTFGISMYVFMNSFMTGVNQTQMRITFNTLAHIHIYNDAPEDRSNLISSVVGSNVLVHIHNPRVVQYKEGIDHAQKILDILSQQTEVVAVAPQVNVNVFFRSGATKVNGVISGVDIEQEDRLFHIRESLLEGDWSQLQHRKDGIFIGSGLARRLGLRTGNSLAVTTADGTARNYEILGVFETTIASLDNSKGYIQIQAARRLISKHPSYVTDIQANIRDYRQAIPIAQQLKPLIPYKVEAWSQANGQLEAAGLLRDITAVAISVTILIVAGFGIYNIMNMTVNEKIREIAILKAMGFSGDDIVQIFLTQALCIGLLGGAVGLALGLAIGSIVDRIPFHSGVLETLPMAYQLKDYVMAFVFGLFTTFIAGYLPARKAASVDPVSIIRG